MRSRRGTGLMGGGLLLLAAALCLTLGNLAADRRAGGAAGEALAKLETLVWQETSGDTRGEPGAPAFDLEVIPDYVLNPEQEMPTVEVDGTAYLGILEIPALGLTLPVQSEWSYPNLELSPCRYSGSAYQGGMILAGHNYSRHFGGLKNLAVGDAVTFTDVSGGVFSYTVAQLEQLPGDALAELLAGDWDLTLFTCTVGGRSRVTVRCSLAE